MPSNALLKVYNRIVFHHFTYCSTVWSNVKNQFYLEKVFKLQKRAARILLNNRDIRTPTSFLFSSLNWMPIRDFYMYRKVVFLFKVLYTQMPNYLNVFRFTRDVSCRQTRSNNFTSNTLYLPRAKTENFKRSFSYFGTSCHKMLEILLQ